MSERRDVLDERIITFLEDELRPRPDRDLLTVGRVVSVLELGQSVVDGVGRRQFTALESQPAEQGVRFDDGFEALDR